MRIGRCMVILLAFARLSPGQTAGEATVTGRITDAATHQPIAGALISYCCGPHRADAVSGADGSYSFHVIPDVGEITIGKEGYASVDVGAPLQPGRTVHDFALSPTAEIFGRIMDRDSGRPLGGFFVLARREDFMRAGLPSNRNGEFRIDKLAPGEYRIEIDPPASGQVVAGKAKSPDAAYGQTWYPGVPRIEMATPITISAGERRAIEIRVQKREFPHFGAVIHVPEGLTPDGIGIMVGKKEAGEGPPAAQGVVPGGGRFHITGLDAGSYSLFASTRDRLFVSRSFDLTERGIDDLELTMRPGVRLKAAFKMAEDDAVPPSGLQFFPDPLFFTGWPDSNTREFLPAGEYWPHVLIPPGYAVVSVVFNGSEHLNTAIDVEADESTVAFVLTSRPAAIGGLVLDADQKPVAAATVALLPETLPELLDKFDPHARRVAKSGEDGRFQIRDLAPGRYKAVALTGDDARRGRDLEFLRARMRSDEAIELRPGQTANVSLRP